MKQALVVFSKTPVIGQVKTRLVPPLTDDQALHLYRALLQDTLVLCSSFATQEVGLFLSLTGEAPASLLPPSLRSRFALLQQEGADLGERLAHCFATLHGKGFTRIAVVGADAPLMRRDEIVDAFHLLGGYDLILGPTEDGGYFLVATTRPLPEIFEAIDWGTDVVLQQTLDRAQAAGVAFALLPEGRDVDRIQDLRAVWETMRRRKKRRQLVPFHTWRVLETLMPELDAAPD